MRAVFAVRGQAEEVPRCVDDQGAPPRVTRRIVSAVITSKSLRTGLEITSNSRWLVSIRVAEVGHGNGEAVRHGPSGNLADSGVAEPTCRRMQDELRAARRTQCGTFWVLSVEAYEGAHRHVAPSAPQIERVRVVAPASLSNALRIGGACACNETTSNLSAKTRINLSAKPSQTECL